MSLLCSLVIMTGNRTRDLLNVSFPNVTPWTPELPNTLELWSSNWSFYYFIFLSLSSHTHAHTHSQTHALSLSLSLSLWRTLFKWVRVKVESGGFIFYVKWFSNEAASSEIPLDFRVWSGCDKKNLWNGFKRKEGGWERNREGMREEERGDERGIERGREKERISWHQNNPMELKDFNDWLLAPKFKGRGFESKFLLLAKRLQILIVSKKFSGKLFDKLTRGKQKGLS